MKNIFHYILSIVVIISIVPASEVLGEMSVATGVRYDSFSDDRAEQTRGTEITFPIGVSFRHQRFSVSLNTAYSQAKVEQADTETNIDKFTDTSFTASVKISGLPVDVTSGIHLNIPTRNERLSQEQKDADLGENNDLVEVDNFGEGFNLGSSLVVVKQLGKLTLGATGSYIYKDKYDPTKDMPGDYLDPGDQLLVATMLNWKMSPRFRFGTSATYSYFTADNVNGKDNFQEGASITLGSTLRFIQQPVGIDLSLQHVIPQKAQRLEGDVLKTEPDNSEGRNLSAMLDVTYARSKMFTLRVLGDIRYYGESERTDEGSGLPYAGERIRYGFGSGMQYAITRSLSCSAFMKYIIMQENQDINLPEDRTITGLNVDVGVMYTF